MTWGHTHLALAGFGHAIQFSFSVELSFSPCNQECPESGLPQPQALPVQAWQSIWEGKLETGCSPLFGSQVSDYDACQRDKLQPKLAHLRGKEKTKSHAVSGCPPPDIWKANVPCQTENLVLYLGVGRSSTGQLQPFQMTPSHPDFKKGP